MIKHPIHGTLDEFLATIKDRTQRGIPLSSAGLTLSWFAQQYHLASQPKPAEPGATIPYSTSLTLQDLDELRELNASGRVRELGMKLEELSLRR